MKPTRAPTKKSQVFDDPQRKKRTGQTQTTQRNWGKATAPHCDAPHQHCQPRHPRRGPPSRTNRQRAAVAGRLVCSHRAPALLLSALRSVLGPTTNSAMGPHSHQHKARPGKHIPGTLGKSINPHKVLRGVLHPGDRGPANTTPARPRAKITSGEVGYHLGLAMVCLSQSIRRRWPTTGAMLWIWAIPTAHTQMEAGPDTRKDPGVGPQ